MVYHLKAYGISTNDGAKTNTSPGTAGTEHIDPLIDTKITGIKAEIAAKIAETKIALLKLDSKTEDDHSESKSINIRT